MDGRQFGRIGTSVVLAVCWAFGCSGPSEHAPAILIGVPSATGGTAGAGGSSGSGAGGSHRGTGGTRSSASGGAGETGGAGGTTVSSGGAGGTSSGGSRSNSGGTSSGGTSSGGTGGITGSGGEQPDGGDGGTVVVDPCPTLVYPGTANIHSMADLSALRGYTAINGDLYIGSGLGIDLTDVSTLAALSCLKTVSGSITILDNPSLVDLTGLARLTSATALKISEQSGFKSLNGLGALSLSDVFLLHNLPALTSLGTGIVAAGYLAISNNASLPQCQIDALANRLALTCPTYCVANDGVCPN